MDGCPARFHKKRHLEVSDIPEAFDLSPAFLLAARNLKSMKRAVWHCLGLLGAGRDLRPLPLSRRVSRDPDDRESPTLRKRTTDASF